MFERIVVVDWSAQAAPTHGPDSIWICALDTRTGEFQLCNPRTRAVAHDVLLAQLADGPRTLVGFDFPLGFPAGFAAASALTGDPPWSAAWQHLAAALVDDDRNRNNRWAVASDLNARLGAPHFWGAPVSASTAHLPRHRPRPLDAVSPAGLGTFRLTEQHLRAAGRRPFSVWQLLGAGSVGSQALTGIALLERLRRHPTLAHRVRIWPFETGLAVDPGGDDIVLAEVWPSAIEFEHVDHPVKDARQVIALAQHLSLRQHDPTLFTPTLDAAAAELVVAEEGWVLDVP